MTKPKETPTAKTRTPTHAPPSETTGEPAREATHIIVVPRDPPTTRVAKSIGLMTDEEREAYQAEHTAAIAAIPSPTET
jgi:hypothetical protein